MITGSQNAANAHRHRLMIKEVPNQCQSLLRALALIENPGSRGTSREQRITLSPLVELPMIKEHLHIGPSSLMITYGERVLGVGTDRLAVVLRRELLIG